MIEEIKKLKSKGIDVFINTYTKKIPDWGVEIPMLEINLVRGSMLEDCNYVRQVWLLKDLFNADNPNEEIKKLLSYMEDELSRKQGIYQKVPEEHS